MKKRHPGCKTANAINLHKDGTMKKACMTLLICIMFSAAGYAGEVDEISSIRSYYNETLKKIKNGSLYQRELSLSYPVVPGTGSSASRVLIFYEMAEGSEGTYGYSIIRVENYYQRAEAAFYEELLYGSDGTLMFYYGRRGSGDIRRADGIRWEYDERFYFRKGRLVRVMYDQAANDRPGPDDIAKGYARIQRAKEIRANHCGIRFPAPVIYTGE
jgi:hypothetical protein